MEENRVRMLAVGRDCPEDIIEQLSGIARLEDVASIFRPLQFCEQYHINIVNLRSSKKLAVTKSYTKSRLTDAMSQQVGQANCFKAVHVDWSPRVPGF